MIALAAKSPETFFCNDCMQEKPILRNGGTGYGYPEQGDVRVCYACIGIRDQKQMIKQGSMILYWDDENVSNWPNSLSFKPRLVAKKEHKWKRGFVQASVWFNGPDGFIWLGINVGDSQILRCRRTSRTWKLTLVKP